MRTRWTFKGMLTWDATAGKVNFEFAPSKFRQLKPAASKTCTATINTPFVKPVAVKSAAKTAEKK